MILACTFSDKVGPPKNTDGPSDRTPLGLRWSKSKSLVFPIMAGAPLLLLRCLQFPQIFVKSHNTGSDFLSCELRWTAKGLVLWRHLGSVYTAVISELPPTPSFREGGPRYNFSLLLALNFREQSENCVQKLDLPDPAMAQIHSVRCIVLKRNINWVKWEKLHFQAYSYGCKDYGCSFCLGDHHRSIGMS